MTITILRAFYKMKYLVTASLQETGIITKPKAYLNFVLFDDQFKLVDEGSLTTNEDMSKTFNGLGIGKLKETYRAFNDNNK